MPLIKDYRFGVIVVDSETYRRDLIVTNDKVFPNWWRKEGHRLHLEDIQSILEEYVPEVLVVGKGYYGYMVVLDEVKAYLKENNIELIEGKTGNVISTFNKLIEKARKVVGAFHLTC